MNRRDNIILSVEGVGLSFGGVVAVNDVSFRLRKGELLGIIGPNGSGKTTLINIITGFLRPDRGRIIYRGKNITGRKPYHMVDLGIARSFQMVRPFYDLPAFKNLVIPLYSKRVKRQRGGGYGGRDEVAVDLLEEVGFERDSRVPYKNAASLPHGYLKRLELARCLAIQPDLLILDEIFSGMSPSEVASMLPIIDRLNRDGLSIIMIEHRLRELFRLAEEVLVLNFGEMIALGTPREVMEKEEVKRAYLGPARGYA